ncbi:hypothetical protein F5Y11DRAFT_350301 [Daldinia sp. FL1419]|nr:hypothetical protein F5Y11DRAFT_350301 [Daldinia sp. FL1419]
MCIYTDFSYADSMVLVSALILLVSLIVLSSTTTSQDWRNSMQVQQDPQSSTMPPPSAWSIHDVEKMAVTLSRIRIRTNKGNIRRADQAEWNRDRGASYAEVESLVRTLNPTSFPRDYFAFLQLNSGLDFFTYKKGPFLQFKHPTEVGWDDAVISEIPPIEATMLPLPILSIERSNRVCLVAPEYVERAAEFWHLLLSSTLLAEDVRRKVTDYYRQHFGGVSPFAKMKSCKRWLVLEQGLKNPGTRIYPSFRCFLANLAKMGSAEDDTGPVVSAPLLLGVEPSDRRVQDDMEKSNLLVVTDSGVLLA